MIHNDINDLLIFLNNIPSSIYIARNIIHDIIKNEKI